MPTKEQLEQERIYDDYRRTFKGVPFGLLFMAKDDVAEAFKLMAEALKKGEPIAKADVDRLQGYTPQPKDAAQTML